MDSLWQTAAGYFASSSGWSVVLYWWFCLLAPGLLALPLTARLSARQFDGAYPLAKALGLVLPAYAVWLLSSLHAAPFARGTVLAALAALGVVAAILYWKDRVVLRGARFWRAAMVEEAMFLLILTGWGLLRYIRPDIADIEKYMNFAFVNASLRAATMPPIDPWYALEPINYYYFGHYLTAYQIKLGGFVPAYGYNLMFATLPAMAFVLTFSIVANAVVFLSSWNGRPAHAPLGNPGLGSPGESDKALGQTSVGSLVAHGAPHRPPSPWTPYIAGLLSAVLMLGGGSLHTVVYGLVQPAVGAWAHPPQPAIFSTGMKDSRPYFWADSRSYIGYNPDTNDKTITEFPAYAFLLGDLHAHVINLVLVLSLLLLLLFFLCGRSFPGATLKRTLFRLGVCRDHPQANSRLEGGALGRFIADLRFVLPAALFLGVFILTNTWDFPIYFGLTVLVILFRRLRDGAGLGPKLALTAAQCAMVAAVPLLVAGPFLHHFHAPAKEVLRVTARSPLWQLAIVWGQQALLMALFAAAVGGLWWKGRKEGRRLHPADAFFLACLLAAAGCVALPEIAYIKDIFGQDYARANTMFKFSFQAYALTAVASCYIACRLVRLVRTRALRTFAAAALAVWLALPLAFIGFAIPGYYLTQPSGSPGLDGLGYLKAQAPEDAAIIDFLNRQAPPGNILEAAGEPYTYSGRISMATGRATILGWRWHERLWRYEPDSNAIEVRRQEVLDIYGPADLARTGQLLEHYDVRYIILAPHERKEMPQLNESKLRLLARPVFTHGEGEVLEVVHE